MTTYMVTTYMDTTAVMLLLFGLGQISRQVLAGTSQVLGRY